MREIKCLNCGGPLSISSVFFVCKNCESTFFDEEINEALRIKAEPYKQANGYINSYIAYSGTSYESSDYLRKLYKSFWDKP